MKNKINYCCNRNCFSISRLWYRISYELWKSFAGFN
nr:MAG TPA: hypothetical protein [Caudoviricetes sp.]